MLNFSFFNSIK